jgi:preprotein translocase subunit SecE
MATSRTQGEAAMTEDSASSALVSKPMSWLESVRKFWREVVLEMKKVSWPARTEVVNTTIIVVIAIFFFALYLFGADIALSYLITIIEWLAQKAIG